MEFQRSSGLEICNVELIINRRNLGTYGCIGKPLALMQMRAIVAKLIMKFDVSFAPDEDGTGLIEKTRDHFSLGLADFNLVFTERQVQEEREEELELYYCFRKYCENSIKRAPPTQHRIQVISLYKSYNYYVYYACYSLITYEA